MIKTEWNLYRDMQKDQWIRIEGPVINPHTYGHLIFDKEAKTIQWKKAFLTNGTGSIGGQHVEEWKLIILISLYKFKWINQGPPRKIRYTETNRGESGEGP